MLHELLPWKIITHIAWTIKPLSWFAFNSHWKWLWFFILSVYYVWGRRMDNKIMGSHMKRISFEVRKLTVAFATEVLKRLIYLYLHHRGLNWSNHLFLFFFSLLTNFLFLFLFYEGNKIFIIFCSISESSKVVRGILLIL